MPVRLTEDAETLIVTGNRQKCAAARHRRQPASVQDSDGPGTLRDPPAVAVGDAPSEAPNAAARLQLEDRQPRCLFIR
jgi:hypothetical protein